jgi:S1-C subfamily serine protease
MKLPLSAILITLAFSCAGAQQSAPPVEEGVKPVLPGEGQPEKPVGAIKGNPKAKKGSQPLEAIRARAEALKKQSEGASQAPNQLEPIIRTNALVKVNATSQGYNPHIPWQKESPGARRGLGVVLAGNRILVTGQMVADATYIELELPESGQKLPAKVVAVDYEANVALLAAAAATPAKEQEFFATLKPMQLDTTARIGDSLAIWQTGRVGDLIVTPMRISKVMTQSYVVDNASFLVFEATGIVRSEANSFTLPVVKGGRLAGLLLRYDSKNQVATLLPAPIIEHFLNDTADGKYDGFPSLGVELQQTLDEQFRDYLGMKNGMKGAFISGVSKGATADYIGVKEGDIILSINGHEVDSRGDYQDPRFGALSISHIVRGRAFVGDKIEMKVLRAGQEVVLSGTLLRKQVSDYLVTPYIFDRGPNYVMMGGLLFQELSKPYLQAFGAEQQNGAILRLSRIAEHPDDYEKAGRKKLVFLSAVLPTPSAQGYERLGGQVVNQVNGKKINDLNDLAEAFKQPKDGIHTIELADFPKILHLDAITAERDNLKLIGGAYRIGSLKRIE